MAEKTFIYQDDTVCTKPDEFDYDVIIVGSGIAGLTAAYNIIKKKCGITVLVLEGSDKIGGRLGISGATRGYFINDRQTHINRLISELGLKAVYRRRIGNEKRVYYSRNGPIVQRENIFHEINDFIDRLDLTAECVDLKTHADYPEAKKLSIMNLDTLIKKFITNFEAQEVMTAIAYTICGVEPASVSALWFIIMAIGAGGLKRRIKFALGSNRRQFVADGADKIPEKLLDAVNEEKIKILTNSPVDLIEFNDVCTYVSVCDSEQCEYVIVAVPPPENSKIRISPPAKKEILRNQRSHESGKGTFFLATYDEAWWLRRNYSGEIFVSNDSNCDFRLVYEATCPATSSPVFLAGFLKGSLKKVKFVIHGYGIRRSDTICRVYWACSEYARCWPGTLDGAVESGEYAACSIIFQLRPQSLNSQELRFITPDTVAARKNDLPLNLVALHFVIMGLVTAILIVYCKPVKLT